MRFLAVNTPETSDYNVLVNRFLVGDEAELFFCGEYVNVISPQVTFLDVLVACGIFPSKGQARKNGYSPEIPAGISDIYIGKRRVRIYLLNPTEQNLLTAQP